MPWNLVLVRSAEKQLRKIQSKDQQRIIAALEQMRADPFSGDVAYLKNQGATLRRRVGDWRLFFDLYPDERLIAIVAIKRRTSTTY